MSLRVSPSLLESHRLLMTEEWMTTERFVEQVTTRAPSTDPQLFGHAVHALVERPDDWMKDDDTGRFYVEEDDRGALAVPLLFVFGPSVISCLNHVWDLDVTHEVWLSRDVHTRYGQVQILGRADAVYGDSILEIKSSYSPRPDRPIQFVESRQWRSYLWLSGAARCTYLYLGFRCDKNDVYELSEAWTLTMRPYGDLERDFLAALNDTLHTLDQLSILDHFDR